MQLEGALPPVRMLTRHSHLRASQTSQTQEQGVGKSTDLLKMLSNVRFLASQDSPMQDDGSGKDSNFIQLHILRDEDNEGHKNWRNEKKQ